jgi:hypothetical protein
MRRLRDASRSSNTRAARRGPLWAGRSGYNLKACPHLKAAFIVDTRILDFSAEVANEPLAHVHTGEDLDRLIAAFRERCVLPLRLWEFFIVHVPDTVEALVDAYQHGRLNDVAPVRPTCTAHSSPSPTGKETQKERERERESHTPLTGSFPSQCASVPTARTRGVDARRPSA